MSNTAPCILLAGGLGTRLQSAIPGLPKCLAPVHGRPFLELLLDRLEAQGFDQIIIALGHLSEMVVPIISAGPHGTRCRFVIDPAPLGTGGAALNAMATFGIEEALVMNGDTFLTGDLAAFRRPLAIPEGEYARLGAVTVPDRARFGGLLMDNEARATAFLEKGTKGPGLINAGFYRLNRLAFRDQIPGSAFSIETVTLPALVARHNLHVAAIAGKFIDIGVPEDYQRFCELASAPEGWDIP